MDRYEATLARITDETDRGALRWEAAFPSTHERVVLNPDRVVRCFAADLSAGGKTFPLLYVERKESRFDEFDAPQETLSRELLVLDGDGRLVLPIYEGLVDREDLIRLAAAISDTNAAAEDFFDVLLAGELATGAATA